MDWQEVMVLEATHFREITSFLQKYLEVNTPAA